MPTRPRQAAGRPTRPKAPAGRSASPAAAKARSKRSADTVARLHEALHRMVISFEIPPDERINEVELARSLHVSRTPLREALNRLATEGLLTFEPNRGFRCRPLDTREILHLYEARKIIEVAAVRLACERASPEAVADLAAFWQQAVAGEGRPATELLRLDEEFHERLAALSGNGELGRALRSINARIHFVRWIDLEREERRARTYVEHGELLDALAARDAERCAEILGAHIERRLDQIVDVIKDGVVRLYLR